MIEDTKGVAQAEEAYAMPATVTIGGKRNGKEPVVELMDWWDTTYGLSGRPKWIVEAARDIITRLHGTKAQVKQAVEEIKRRGLAPKRKPIDLETVDTCWWVLTQPI